MKCPTCPNDTLVMAERSGIEIDYCQTCRGVWLDRGELDKIIERSVIDAAPTTALHVDRPDRYDDRSDRPERYDDRSDRYEDGSRRSKKRRRESLLGELFDF